MYGIVRVYFMVVVLAVCVSLVAGCGDDDVVAPAAVDEGEEEEEIKTPVTLVLNKIYCARWPEKKADGSAWDTFGGRPDIYFQVGNHTTNRFDNHQWQVVMHAYFPPGECRMNYNDTFVINMWDADSPSADDKMSSLTFSPRDIYFEDNAESVTIMLTGTRGATYQLYGNWIYP